MDREKISKYWGAVNGANVYMGMGGSMIFIVIVEVFVKYFPPHLNLKDEFGLNHYFNYFSGLLFNNFKDIFDQLFYLKGV